MSTFRILSFDGGGIKGALSSRLLKLLVDYNPTLLEKTDLIAGTSTGSLIALLAAYGFDAKTIDNIYSYENIKRVFTPKRINLLRPKYNNKHLKKLITKYISEDITLKDLKKYVVIPGFSLTGIKSKHWEEIFFNNLYDNFSYNKSIIDIALAACAAPTYFPSHENFIDGGVVTNSPSIASVLLALKYFKPKFNINDFKVISIGTGCSLKKITNNTKNWGVLQWALRPFASVKLPIISILLNDTAYLENMYCTELLEKNFFRLNPLLFEDIEIDNYNELPNLKNLADNYNLNKANKFIQEIYLK